MYWEGIRKIPIPNIGPPEDCHLQELYWQLWNIRWCLRMRSLLEDKKRRSIYTNRRTRHKNPADERCLGRIPLTLCLCFTGIWVVYFSLGIQESVPNNLRHSIIRNLRVRWLRLTLCRVYGVDQRNNSNSSLFGIKFHSESPFAN